MGETTAIAWTQRTWNPWTGCRKISPGCKFCYMFREKRQYGQDPEAVVRSKTTFNAPLKWKEPALIFTCSWSDWFIEEADGVWRSDAYGIIGATPHHTYQILTKRSARFADLYVPNYQNVWWGVSVENRKHGLPRVDQLRELDVTNRFLSIEPLLEDVGPIDLAGIGWVIVGGESGPERRTMDVAWLAAIVDQCAAQRVPVFVKQDSGFKSGLQGRIPGELFVREFPRGMVRP